MRREKKIFHIIVGARPNFMKAAPLYHRLSKEKWCRVKLINTGQHYHKNMSSDFFDDLNLPRPAVNLNVRGKTHAEQVGRIMVAYERAILKERPSCTIVVGDVNSTLASALAAKKCGVIVAHVEAGLRSFDRTMPEEINRVLTDSIADILWTPSEDGDENLAREGIAIDKVEFVGNIMIDALVSLKEKIVRRKHWKDLGLTPKKYIVATLHRPSNVDNFKSLSQIVYVLKKISSSNKIVFPVHPRTLKALKGFGLMKELISSPNIVIEKPLSYIPFMSLVERSSLIITDSGGIQEETTYLGIPCLTLRDTTERPITITHGTNKLVNINDLCSEVERSEALKRPRPRPKFWDGFTSDRIAKSLKRYFLSSKSER